MNTEKITLSMRQSTALAREVRNVGEVASGLYSLDGTGGAEKVATVERQLGLYNEVAESIEQTQAVRFNEDTLAIVHTAIDHTGWCALDASDWQQWQTEVDPAIIDRAEMIRAVARALQAARDQQTNR